MEHTRMANRGGKGIRLGKETLSILEVFKTQSLDVRGKETKLTEAVVSMSMEATNQGPVLKFFGSTSKRATGKCDAKLAADVIPTSNFRPKGF
jgi:hypothetical protein